MKSIKGTTITKGSSDVSAELGFSPAESSNLRIRSELMTALREFIEEEGLTQADAAKRLKVSQPRISDLARGKISRFSLDSLVNVLSDVGLELDLRIRPTSRRVDLRPTGHHGRTPFHRGPLTRIAAFIHGGHG